MDTHNACVRHVHGGVGFHTKKPNLVPFILNPAGKVVDVKSLEKKKNTDNFDEPPKFGSGADAPFPTTSQASDKKGWVRVPLLSSPSPALEKKVPGMPIKTPGFDQAGQEHQKGVLSPIWRVLGPAKRVLSPGTRVLGPIVRSSDSNNKSMHIFGVNKRFTLSTSILSVSLSSPRGSFCAEFFSAKFGSHSAILAHDPPALRASQGSERAGGSPARFVNIGELGTPCEYLGDQDHTNFSGFSSFHDPLGYNQSSTLRRHFYANAQARNSSDLLANKSVASFFHDAPEGRRHVEFFSTGFSSHSQDPPRRIYFGLV